MGAASSKAVRTGVGAAGCWAPSSASGSWSASSGAVSRLMSHSASSAAGVAATGASSGLTSNMAGMTAVAALASLSSSSSSGSSKVLFSSILAVLAASGFTFASTADCDIDFDKMIERLESQADREDPGSFEDMQGASRLQIQAFDGASMVLAKGFSPSNESEDGPPSQENLQIAQNVCLGKSDMGTPAGAYYHLITTYNNGPSMLQGVFVSPGNSVFTQAGTKLLDDKLEVQLNGNVSPMQPQLSSVSANVAFHGDDYTAEIKARRDGGGNNSAGFAYLQSVGNGLTLGADAMYNGGANKLDYTFAGAYKVDSDNRVSSWYNVPNRSLQCNYARDVTSQLKLMSELTLGVNPADLNSQMAVGAEFHLRLVPTGGTNPSTGEPEFVPYTVMKSQMTDDGKLVVAVDHMMLSGQAKLKLCSSMHHTRRDYRFGVGVEVNY